MKKEKAKLKYGNKKVTVKNRIDKNKLLRDNNSVSYQWVLLLAWLLLGWNGSFEVYEGLI